ncbi:hypothetical protein CcaCcLH18_00726 [Colletotrichum camelliae]|nr:hypothetical protein CcaCcLH18_00726 [Colletotrichum camelliae]
MSHHADADAETGPEISPARVSELDARIVETSIFPGPPKPPDVYGPRDNGEVWDAADFQKQAVEVDWKAKILALPLLVSVGEFDFENFKNRWGEDARYHVVELLMASAKSVHEVSGEVFEREKYEMDEKRLRHRERRRKINRNRPRPEAKSKSFVGDTWIQRIRVHSPIILHYLLEATEAPTWDAEKPRVFFRPFKCLIHCHSHIKKTLQALQEKLADPTLASQTTVCETIDGSDTEPKDGDISVGSVELMENDPKTGNVDLLTGPMAIEHLRTYVEFMDNKIMPMKNMFDNTENRMVRFDDLWFLFKVGDVLYEPPTPEFPANDDGDLAATKRYQTAFVLHRKVSPQIRDDTPDDLLVKGRWLKLCCFYIDYDGESFGPVTHTIKIQGFYGQRDIRDLKVYPLRFSSNVDTITAKLMKQGQTFRRFVQEKHVRCEGWTLTGSPLASWWDSGDVETPMHVDSDVIIDFGETLRRKPLWRTEFDAPVPVEISDDWQSGDDDLRLAHWPDPEDNDAKATVLFQLSEQTQLDDDVDDKHERTWIEADPFLKAFANGNTKSLDGLNESISNLLLPQRAFVYVLRQRCFAMVNVFALIPVDHQPTIFDDLKIDEGHKLIVQSLVADHFEKRKMQRQNPTLDPTNQDLVRGKGSGLFILLHGVPGVGKTATAEAVAQANNKPLFSMTCGDLGVDPSIVDDNLTDIFRLAQIWDRVLLLDEADIFLAKRDNHNLKRNALVSVFLRVLEHYGGILFLTTNRVGTLDEAFKSRIHISLYYEPLNRNQTLEIFILNLKKLRVIEAEKQAFLEDTGVEHAKLEVNENSIMEYAEEHFDAHSTTPHLRWNGRQIRNAFQIASSLAHYHVRKASLSNGPVAVAIERFGRYMDYTRAMTDRDEARIEAIRADNIRNVDLTPRPASRYYEDVNKAWEERAKPSADPRMPEVRSSSEDNTWNRSMASPKCPHHFAMKCLQAKARQCICSIYASRISKAVKVVVKAAVKDALQVSELTIGD